MFLKRQRRRVLEGAVFTGFTPLEVRCQRPRQTRKRVLLLPGFTLIELLVVISIIALLSSVVFAATNRARERGLYGTILSNIQALKLAPELYFDDVGFYPPDVGRGWDPGFM